VSSNGAGSSAKAAVWGSDQSAAVAERTQLVCRVVGVGEVVAAEQVDVVVTERGEPLDVGVVDGVAVAPELGEGGVEVAGVPQQDGV